MVDKYLDAEGDVDHLAFDGIHPKGHKSETQSDPYHSHPGPDRKKNKPAANDKRPVASFHWEQLLQRLAPHHVQEE